MRNEWAYKEMVTESLAYRNGDFLVAERQASRLLEKGFVFDSSAIGNSTRGRVTSTGRGVGQCGRRKPMKHMTPKNTYRPSFSALRMIEDCPNPRATHPSNVVASVFIPLDNSPSFTINKTLPNFLRNNTFNWPSSFRGACPLHFRKHFPQWNSEESKPGAPLLRISLSQKLFPHPKAKNLSLSPFTDSHKSKSVLPCC